MHRTRMRSASTGRSHSAQRKYNGHRLTACGQQTGMTLILCKDNKWRPLGGNHKDVRLFPSQLQAEQHGQAIHDRQRMQSWSFTAQEDSYEC